MSPATRLLIRLAAPLTCCILLALSAGCTQLVFGYSAAAIALTARYADYNVLVLDGDTRQPIASAIVWTPPRQGAFGAESRTDSHGRARIRMPSYIGSGLYADAAGYLPGRTWTGTVSHSDTDITLELYRPPEPVCGLTVPVDYRGIVRVKLGSDKPAPIATDWTPGQREFYTPVNVNGITELLAPPFPRGQTRYGAAVSFARWDDGTPLRFENPISGSGWSGEYLFQLPDLRERVPPRADGVALYKLGFYTEGAFAPPLKGHAVYFVGTQPQAAAAQQELLRGATPEVPGTPVPVGQYLFKPLPLDTTHLPVGAQLSPRQHPG
jgi:hypothetical protein